MYLTRNPWRLVRMRRAAQQYAAHGWPVVPGAVLSSSRFICGPGCRTVACHPWHQDWEQIASTDPAQIAHWWAREPHAVLLATGHSFDVLDLPAWLGREVVAGPIGGPVAVTPTHRWLFLVRPGGTLRPRLANNAAVVLHRTGSWLPAPPTTLVEGVVRWLVAPHHTEWCLAACSQVQQAALRALSARQANPVANARHVPQTA